MAEETNNNVLGAHVTIDASEIEAGAAKYTGALAKMADSTAKFAKTAEESFKKVGGVVDGLNDAIQFLGSSTVDITKVLSELSNSNTTLSSAVAQAESSTRSMSTQMEKSSSSTKKAKQSVEELQATLQKAQQTIEQNEQSITNNNQKLTEYEKQLESLRTKSQQLNDAREAAWNNGEDKQVAEYGEAIRKTGKEIEEIVIAMSNLKKQNSESNAAIEESKRVIDQTNQSLNNAATAPVAIKKQVKELTYEAQALTAQYRAMSEEERQSAEGQALKKHIDELTEKAGQLSDVMADTRRGIKGEASDTKQLDSLVGSLGLVTDSYGIATSAAQIFGASTEDVQEAQARLQSIMVLSNSITDIQNKLQKESAVMMGVARVQKALATAAEEVHTAAVGKGIVATKAATVAQWALNAAAEANPYVLLATAIITVVGAIAMWTYNTKKQKEEEEKLQKELEYRKQLLQDITDVQVQAGKKTLDEITKIRALHDALKDTNTTYDEKKKALQALQEIVPDYHGSLTAEGVLINDNAAALETYIENLSKVAYAQALFDKMVEAQQSKLEADIELKTKQGNKNAVEKQINKLKSKGLDTKAEVWYDSFGKAHEITTETGAYSKQKAALNAWDKAIDETEDKVKKAQHRIEMLENMITKDSNSLVEALVGSDNKKTPSKTTGNSNVKEVVDEYELQLTYLQKAQKDQLDSMEYGSNEYFNKQIELIETEAKLNKLALDKEYQDKLQNVKDKEALEKNYQELVRAEEEKTAKAKADVERQRTAAEIESRLSYLSQYGSVEEKRLAIEEEYSKKIAEAKNDWEKRTLEAEKTQKLSELSSSEILKNVDWDNAFGDLSTLTTKYLEALEQQITNILGSKASQLSVEDIARLQGRRAEIRNQLSSRGGWWSNSVRDEYSRRQAAQNDAQERVNLAREKAESAKGTALEAKAKEDLINAEQELALATEAVTKSFNAAVLEFASDLANVKGYLESFNELASVLGLSNSKAGRAGQRALQGVNSAIGAAEAFSSGDYVGAAVKALSAVKDVGGAIFNLVGISGGNAEKWAKTNDRLIRQQEYLRQSIDSLTEAMTSSNSAKEITKTYETAKKYQEQLIEAQRQKLLNNWGYTNAHHSNAYYWGSNVSASDYARISQAAGTSVGSYSDFMNLTPEQMARLRMNDYQEWQHLMEDIGEYGDRWKDDFEAYADMAGDLAEITEKWQESIAGVSFSSMFDEFVSTLMDMDASSRDFASKFGEYMTQALLKDKISELFEDRLNAIYSEWVNLQSSGLLTEAKANELKAKWDAVAQEAFDVRDSIAKLTGYGEDVGYSATTKSVANINQDTSDAILGRITAIDIQSQQQTALQTLISQDLQIVKSYQQLSGTAISEIRDIQTQSVSLLSSIDRSTRNLYEMRDFLERIEQHTKSL